MKGLNLAAFEKVKEDKNTVHMKHKDGHVIMIALRALPKIQREQIKRLKMADGGDVQPASPPVPINPQDAQTAQDSMRKAFNYDDGGPVSDDSSDQSQPPVTVNVNSGPTPSTAAQMGSQPVQVQQPSVSPQNPPVLLPNGSMSASGAAQTGQQAVGEQAGISSAQSQALLPLEQAKAKAQSDQAQQDQSNINSLKASTDTVAGRIKDIDPNHYMENRSTGTKVGQAFGLLLGGMSTGAHGGSNPAMDYINNQINRDIDAQKQNNENQKTIYGFYNNLYGNENVASGLAKKSMADIYSSKVDQVAAQLGTAQAMQKAHEIKANLAVTGNKGILEAAGNLGSTPNMPRGGNSGGMGPQGSPNIQPISAPGAQQQTPQNNDSTILKPGAEARLSQMLKFDHTIPDADKQKMSEQMTQASQSQKSLSDVDDTFERLVAGSRKAGWSGRIHRTINPHILAGVGTAAGAALGSIIPGAGTAIGAGVGGTLGEGLGQSASALTNTDTNRQFESDKSRLAGVLSSAVPRGSEFIGRLLEDNTPEYKDDTATLKRKLGAIKEFIMNHTETDALKRHGLSYK